jgi:predicted enzyme related to lactoylglutathione lyase
MSRVVHFEITADEPERAAEFYAKVFGWKLQRWTGSQPYWLATTGAPASPGIDGAIMHRHDSGQKVINTVGVESWDEAAEAIAAAGGKVGDRNVIPGVGTFAYCQDTEGNLFGIMENAPARMA